MSDQLEVADDPLHLVRWNAISAPADRRRAAWSSAGMAPRSSGDGEGNGPVDALLQAIDAAVAIPCELEYYHVEAVTPGEDAQGQVNCGFASATRSTPVTDSRPISSRRARAPIWRR